MSGEERDAERREPQQFTKKPVTIWALPFDGTFDGVSHVEKFIGHECGFTMRGGDPPTYEIWIETLEGGHTASPGDWIIKGVAGEFYPCKPDIFTQTYEPAEARAALREPAQQEAPQLPELLAAWDTFYANLPDGEYKGLGELRLVINLVKKSSTPAQTPPSETAQNGSVAQRCADAYLKEFSEVSPLQSYLAGWDAALRSSRPTDLTAFLETVAWNKGCTREYLAQEALKLLRSSGMGTAQELYSIENVCQLLWRLGEHQAAAVLRANYKQLLTSGMAKEPTK